MVLTCREVYQKAHERRASHPLKSGRYKLNEAIWGLYRLEVTLALKGRPPDPYDILEKCLPHPVCMPKEFWSWGRKLPHILADDLGYYLLPAVESLVRDGIPVTEVYNILDRIEPEATKFLATAEIIRLDIQGRPTTKRQVAALFRLVEDMLRLFTAVYFSTNRDAGLREHAKQ